MANGYIPVTYSELEIALMREATSAKEQEENKMTEQDKQNPTSYETFKDGPGEPKIHWPGRLDLYSEETRYFGEWYAEAKGYSLRVDLDRIYGRWRASLNAYDTDGRLIVRVAECNGASTFLEAIGVVEKALAEGRVRHESNLSWVPEPSTDDKRYLFELSTLGRMSDETLMGEDEEDTAMDEPPEDPNLHRRFTDFQELVSRRTRFWDLAVEKGFRTRPGETKQPTMRANLHGEISELWEAHRRRQLKEPCDKVAYTYEDTRMTCAEEEVADIVIRALDQMVELERIEDTVAHPEFPAVEFDTGHDLDTHIDNLHNQVAMLATLPNRACIRELARLIAYTVELAYSLDVNPVEAVEAKHAYNKTRPHKHGKVC